MAATTGPDEFPLEARVTVTDGVRSSEWSRLSPDDRTVEGGNTRLFMERLRSAAASQPFI